MSKEIDVNSEPLPGYRLIERIGSGGYGEVWRAEAPGGLTKAIKFVFGQQHEKRAVNESRALDHIRGVRHPFLLSLERIEVIDGRLLIVSELADGSVKDRFDQCRRDDLRGIPRDELLSYLRDAADALDFMSSAHALQHLDIKPENLLLLAGYVKVADFGLVKDVRQSQASLVGGMTPLYAAPEVFRGAPSRHSDQYSLAIVYQEMLTGTLPFVGSSAAELTLQHLNEEPDLSALSVVDRYSVSRALSKDPQHRYATCRELIDTLVKVGTTAATADASAPGSQFSSASEFVDPTIRETQQADFCDEGQPACWNADSSQMLLELPPADCQLVDLPPIDLTGRDARRTPTLVLGIGGTAGRVLTHLRRMVGDQWGSANEIPAVQFLLVDTDARGLADAARGEANGLTADEMLNLPLRRPQHYRENSQQLLHWLSRRWLYNIPRSLRTEGLRPLGRLALADHSRQAGQRMRRAMVQALDATAIAKSTAASGQEFRSDALRVIVVASISGGTGGGMSLDIGYAVRAILQKLGLAHAQIIGLMMHSTGRDARQGELARVNAYSWLTEYQHFQQFDNPYPGDVSCGLPAHAAGVPPFDHTYLLQLGENLESLEFDHATQAVAEYIRLNTLSSAGAFFDGCRITPSDDTQLGPASTARVRSFGVYRQMAAPTEFCDEFASVVSQHVLSTWRGVDPARSEAVSKSRQAATQNLTTAPKTFSPEADDIQLVKRLQLDAGGISANARSLMKLELGMEPVAFVAVWLQNQAAGDLAPKAVLASLDQVFGGSPSSDETEHDFSLLGRTSASVIMPLAEKLQSEVRRWVMRRIDAPSERLMSARRALGWVTEHLGRVEGELERQRAPLADKLIQLRADVASPNIGTTTNSSGNARPVDPNWANEYFRLRLEQVTFAAAQDAIHVLQSDTKAISDELTSLGREIDQIAAAVGRAASARAISADTDANGSNATVRGRLAIGFQAQLSEVAAQIDARLQAEYLDANGGLAKTIMQGGRPRAQLTAKLHELSRKAVYQALAGVNLQPGTGRGCDGLPGNDLHSALAMATPALLEYGGRRRVLAILPGESAGRTSAESVSQSLGVAVTAVHGTDGNLTLCVEADGLSLEHIALEFVERRRDRVDFANRVHCRTDIAWTPLISAEAPRDSAIWNSDVSRQTQSQNAMCKTLVM